MYGFPKDLDLTALVGAEITQIRLLHNDSEQYERLQIHPEGIIV